MSKKLSRKEKYALFLFNLPLRQEMEVGPTNLLETTDEELDCLKTYRVNWPKNTASGAKSTKPLTSWDVQVIQTIGKSFKTVRQ